MSLSEAIEKLKQNGYSEIDAILLLTKLQYDIQVINELIKIGFSKNEIDELKNLLLLIKLQYDIPMVDEINKTDFSKNKMNELKNAIQFKDTDPIIRAIIEHERKSYESSSSSPIRQAIFEREQKRYGSSSSPIGSGSRGGGCFIATAVYGSPLDEDVIKLCKFRDNFLLKNSIGMKFTKCYYKYSPYIASLIRKNNIIKYLFKYSLKLIILIIDFFFNKP